MVNTLPRSGTLSVKVCTPVWITRPARNTQTNATSQAPNAPNCISSSTAA